MKILALHLNQYIEYAQVRGVCINNLPDSAKHFSYPSNETALISEEEFYRVIGYINEEIKDELWGIKAGNFIALKLLGLIYRISLQTTTIAEALYYLQSYMADTLPIIKTETNVTEKWVDVTLTIANEQKMINRIILENTLTIIGREIAMMTEDDIQIRLGTPFYNDAYDAAWEHAAAFTISFEPGVLKAALRKRAHLNLGILIPQYLRMIEQLKPGDSFTNRVKLTMLSMSDPELPDMQRLCHALCVTPRTLERRLRTEDITLRELVEELKKQICTHLLRHEHYSVSAISYVLGYSEPASFLHSFKKWFGHTPERIRQRLKNN